MNKKNIWPILLVILPIIAMLIAWMPNSVTYQYPDGETVYMSYFEMSEDTENGVCLPAAGIAVGLTLLFAVANAVGKKAYWLKAISGPSLAAAVLAAMPYIMKEDVVIVPNVVVPVLMLVEWMVVYKLTKQVVEVKPEEVKGHRLSKEKR